MWESVNQASALRALMPKPRGRLRRWRGFGFKMLEPVMGYFVVMRGPGFRINGFRRWWRSVWVSVFGGGGFQLFVVMRRACFWGTTTLSLHALDTYVPIVERRFLCFVSFSPLEKEMKSRHGQWLIVQKKSARNERAKT